MEKKPITYGIFQISLTLINTGMSLIFVVALAMSWEGRIWGIGCAYTFIGIASGIFLFKKGFIGLTTKKKDLIDMITFGLPLIPHSMSGWIMNAIGRLFINRISGVAATGVFTVGYQVGMVIGLVANAFNQAWTPFFFRQLNDITSEKKRKLVKISYLYFLSIILFALMISFISPYLMKIIAGKNFGSAYKYVIWVALGYACKGMYYMVAGYIFYLKKTHWLSTITISTGLLNIILNYFFITWYGPIGSAYATFIVFASSFLLTFFVSFMLYPMPWLSFNKIPAIATNELSN